jgi:hypothetical protein
MPRRIGWCPPSAPLGAGAKAIGEITRQVEHFAEPVADRQSRMIGTKRGLPFERAQQLLSDRVVVGMA